MSKQSDCQECGQDHAKIRALCESSTFETARILCGYNEINYPKMYPSEVFHKRALDRIDGLFKDGCRRFVVMWPRDHLKTSVLTIGFNIRMICCDAEYRSFVMHKSATHAENMIGAMQSILMSQEFRHYYPEIVPNNWLRTKVQNGKFPRWNQAEIEVCRRRFHLQANFTAMGIETTIEGGHVNAVFGDDLVDRRTSSSPILMERACDFVENVYPLLTDEADDLVMFVGTYWPGGYYEKILANSDYEQIVLGCYQDARSKKYLDMGDVGKPLWFEKHTIHSLAAIERGMGTYKFAHQYRNDPVAKGSARFRAEDFRFYDYFNETRELCYEEPGEEHKRKVKIDSLRLTMAVDPSAGGDDFAITVLGVDPLSGNIFLLECFAEPVSPSHGISQIFRIAKRWNIRKCGIEQAGFQSMLSDWMRVKSHETGQHMRVIPLKHGNRTKANRIIDGMQPFVEEGRFFVHRKRHARVIQQAVNYNPEIDRQQDDILDSIAYHRDLWRMSGKMPKDSGGEYDPDIPFNEDAPRREEEAKPIYGLRNPYKNRRAAA